MLLRPAFTAAAVIISLSASPAAGTAQPPARPTRVLLLYQQQAETQPMLDFTERLRAAVRDGLGSPVEFYQESLDFDRFAGREQSSPLGGYFDDKYRDFGIDVVVPVGRLALRFAVDQLSEVLPRVPIVFALCAAPQTDPSTLPANVTGRLAEASRFAPTVEMARRLQPDAEHIVVVGGAGTSDSTAVTAALRAIATLSDAPPTTLLQGLPLDVLLGTLRELPRRSIVVFANYRRGPSGQAFEPLDIVGSLARASAAPMYAQLQSYVGEGVVGGSVTRFDDEGLRTGDLIVRVLRRVGDRMPPVETIVNTFVADARQLRRWGLSDARLPARTELFFQDLTPWRRYRVAILLTLGVIGAELALIGLLLLERRRRQRAQHLAEEAQRQVAHMGRVAVVGELMATIAHELRQPLTAIRANAQSGVKVVTRGAGHLAEEDRPVCREIFSDIIADNERASDIITRVHALLRHEELPQRPVDLNEICRTAARLLRLDAVYRQAEVVLSLDSNLPVVTGDPIQLQQVVLNLALNGLDAAMSSGRPRVVIGTVARDEEIEITVHDNGPGLSPEIQPHLFEPFFTTKSEGLGLGLAIVQSIVERHQGRVRAENRDEGGAMFRVVVSRMRHPRVGSPETKTDYAEVRRATPAPAL